ncbi:glycoside hydrolase family 3 C-terminal domain-containing protein [Streptomyces sp. NPDC044571]|uniref:glycoside hydrolase family 3 C-terminal domain-containing protein n=1 Tax=Streptomyces sp. NPDC044571 TaxID=3155371 RepID=UPI0033E995F6
MDPARPLHRQAAERPPRRGGAVPGPARSGRVLRGGLFGSAPVGFAVRRRSLALAAGVHRLAVTAEGGDKGQRFRLLHTSKATRAADLAEAVETAEGPWLSRTAALLQMYYPGEEGAAATAGILFGDVDPGGRLTVGPAAARMGGGIRPSRGVRGPFLP